MFFPSWELLRIAVSGPAGRRLASMLAIAVGVALGYAVQLVHSVAVAEMEQAARSLAGEADLVVQSAHGGMEESLYGVLALRSEVAAASPVIEIDARLPERREKLRLLGIDVFRAAQIQPALVARDVADPLDTLRSDRIFLNPSAAAWLGAEVGGEVVLQAGMEPVRLRVGGIIGLPGPRIAVMDIAGAQAAFGAFGRISRIELRLAPGVSSERFAREIGAILPEGAWVEAAEAQAGRAAGFTRAYRVNLNVLALVALFAGGLLVFSSQALAVVRRRTQYALLRALGLTRRQLFVLILLEGALIGAAGALAGIVVGYFLAHVLLQTVGTDLGAAYFRGIEPALALEPAAAAAFFLLGTAASVAGSIVPAREMARASPARALHAGDEERAFAGLPAPWAGMLLMAAGLLLTLAPPLDGLPYFGYCSIALLLLGSIALLPRAAAAMFSALPLPRAAVPQLALLQLKGAPGQASVSLAPLVASIALAAAMSIMVASFRTSLIDWLDRVLPAELYLRAGSAGDTGFFTPDEQARIAMLPGVRRADFLRSDTVPVAPGKPRLVLLAGAVDRAAPERHLPLTGPAVAAEAGETPLWASEVAADVHGWRVGEQIELVLAGRSARFLVAGVWRDYARAQGAIAIERRAYVALTGDERANDAALWLEPGASPEAVRRAATALLPRGSVEAALPSELRQHSLALFDRTFAATYALEGVAVAIGLAGLSASFAALVLARRREFGVLRHLGMRPREIGAMLAAQGALLGGVALAVGLSLGWLVSLILIHVVNRQSFHWSMDLAIPWRELLLFAGTLLVLAVATAAISGRQAMRREAVLAVKEDW